jgi:hypothetical protein
MHYQTYIFPQTLINHKIIVDVYEGWNGLIINC